MTHAGRPLERGLRLLAPAILAITLVGAACGDDDSDDGGSENGTSTAVSSESETSTTVGGASESEAGSGREAGDAPSDAITLEQAEEAALRAVGEGQVTDSGPEDDRGAAWEVEVTRPDGSEVDVLVAADGSIIAIVDT